MNELESRINEYIKYLDSVGIHAHKNHPDRMHDGQYRRGGGEPFDYEIFAKSGVKCFDAKMTTDDYLRLRPKEIKQANNLIKCEKAGHQAFFLIYFSHRKKLTKISASAIQWVIAHPERQKTIHFKDCEETTIDDIGN